MLIRMTLSTQKAEKYVDLDGKKYVFKRKNGEEGLICDVEDEKHIARLLSIDCYELADPSSKLPGKVLSMIRPVENNVRKVTQHEFATETEVDDYEGPGEKFVQDITELVIDSMSVKDIRAYSRKVMDVNPASRDSIVRYARKNYDLVLSDREQPSVLLRHLLKHMQRLEREERSQAKKPPQERLAVEA